MLQTYGRILNRPGTALFSATGLVARLPISMVGLGTVLLVEDASGSYGLAGAVSAAGLVANAGFAILQGRLIDRFGQSRVLPLAITVWGVALSLAVLSVEADWPIWTTFVLAAIAGASLPSVGSCVRARWAHVLDDDRERETAFALEAVADETVYIAGPIIVTVLATAVDPVAGLATALVAGLAGTYGFSAQRGTEPPANPRPDHHAARAPMPWGTVVSLSIVSLALGSLFGSAEVTTVAFAEEQGAKGMAGVLLALWAAGSLIAGFLTGGITWRRGLLVRLRVGAAAMALAMVPLALIDSLLLMGVVLFVAGFAIAPTLIATMSLTEQSVPPSRLTEGMAFVQTGIVFGVAPGATVAGVVIDAAGASPAYLVSVAGGAIGLAAALATRPVTTRRGVRTPA
ncbi:MFS transporter [Nocardioides sp. 1609]|uniref:MFS transporter n=1 Tax=Nocardioides sp. 1609 TaxID=2508327 RepID=UPI00106FBA9C|nr:MFS transporter [Nocardioides sp. 1609]